MKPIKLIMNAFGSFLDTTEIDFTLLNNSGIYLITGATGSGKTTIFDAIMFALYGEASGQTRNADGFRSDFAEDKNPTYVEFIFEKDNVIYKITRSPRYSVSYRTTPLEAKASLEYNDVVIEKTNFVNESVKEIIGLTCEQFKQVIMLAQGEFMKLIHAKSQERDEIFRKIFGTEIFERITKLLKEETKEVKDNLKISEELIKQLIIKIPNVTDYDNYSATLIDLNNTSYLLEELDNNIDLNKKVISKLDKEIKDLNKKLVELNTFKETAKLCNEELNTLASSSNELEELDNNINDINEKKLKIKELNEVSKIKTIYEKLLAVNIRIKNISETYETNKATLEEKQETLNFFIDQSNMIELDRISLENLKKTKEEIEKNINLKKEIEKELIVVSSKEIELNNLQNKLDLFASKESEILDSIDKLKEEINTLNTVKTTYELTIKKIELTKEDIKKINQQDDLYHKGLDLFENVKSLLNSYEELLVEYNIIHNQYITYEQTYFNNLAGVLAKELKENTPCPVCGSLSHPNIAVVSKEVISKEELDNFFEKVELVRNKKDEKLLEIETLKTKYSSLINQLLTELSLHDESLISEELNNLKIKKNEELNNLEKELEQLVLKLTEIKDKESILSNLEKELTKIKEGITTFIQTKDSLNNTISSIKGKVLALEEQLVYSNSIEELELAIAERNEAIEMLEYAIKGFDEEYASAKEEHQLIKGKVEENINQLSNLKVEQDETLKTYNDLITTLNLNEHILNNIDIYIIDLNNLPEYVKEVTTFETKHNNLKQKVEELNNKLSGKEYVDIQVLEDDINNLESKLNELKNNYSEKNLILSNQQQISKELSKSLNIYKTLTIQFDDLSKMSLASSGQNKKYLSFERYVLVEYFDNILTHANMRLKKMTNGRYLLYRKVDKSKGRAQQGLEMEIFDFETGKKRDVKTLSGGETFKAALSLALGLADAIENKVGNISIDTLFIDEGFGTLDEESLNQAIDILLELNSDNKTIGIISHVQELKDIIPTKLIVTKTSDGSKVKIVS